MGEGRLGKIQKEILLYCKGKEVVYHKKMVKDLARKLEYTNNNFQVKPAFRVSISRSVRCLYKKGLIEVSRWSVHDYEDWHGFAKLFGFPIRIRLTGEGYDKVKNL